ncbi:MAG TPA: sensor domain-containing diguanylate cyclase, partial [Variovorax sp.]|nr:sensor domain-containing diguanylate cyclase [Variovorax sp.]
MTASSSPQKNRTLRATVAFVVSICLALVAVNAWLIWKSRAADFRQATVATTNLTRAVSQRMNAMFSEVGHVLDSLAYELERADITPAALERLQPVLVNQVATIDQVHGLFVYDAAGRWIAHSEPVASPNANNADRAYFIHHRDSISRQWHIGTPIVSRSTQVWIIPVSRRIDDADGRFAGVVLATVRLDYVLRLMGEFDIGRQGAIALIQSNGAIMARLPFAQDDLGKSIVGSPLYAMLSANRAGTTETRSPVDGVQRMVSYQHLPDHPLVMAVAVAEDDLLRDWRTSSIIQSAWILSLCVLIGVAGSRIIALVRLRWRTELSLQQAHGELERANAQLAELARNDGLTGLFNRRHFDQQLDQAFRQAARHDRCLALIMIDVDFFKRYNDVYGHPEGDRCLQQVAQAIRAAVRRPGDFVARYGGEEMAVLLPDTDDAGATIVAETIRKSVLALDIPHEGHALGRVSISAGIAAFP